MDINVKDVYGNRVGSVSGGDIKDASGNKAGYVEGGASNTGTAAAAILLLGLNTGNAGDKAAAKPKGGAGDIWDYVPAKSAREKPAGFWAFLVFTFRFFSWAVNFRETFDFSQTASRKEWWGACLRMLVLFFVIFFVIALVGLGQFDGVVIVWLLLVLIPVFAVSIRRMHDIGKRGWWVLVPFVGFVMCGFFPGKVDGNPYIN
jgi:hypothetical protein